jgi:thymidylate synthase (FAD)
MRKVTILRGDSAPTIVVIGQMKIDWNGVRDMASWVEAHRPECMPDDYDGAPAKLFPHDFEDKGPGRILPAGSSRERRPTDNELLVELAGRKCYDSFWLKAGRKSNAEYIANTQGGDIPHASILYNAKLSFFFAGISRRVSHEVIRNYVGSDRDEEGAPSQESTRFTHHYGFFIEPPKYTSTEFDYANEEHRAGMQEHFRASMQVAYDNYLEAVDCECRAFERRHGKPATSLDKKRIYEAASSFLPHQAETSFIWTTNPQAIAKLVRERDNPAADLEIQRFAKKLKRVSVEACPNLFPQPWMRLDAAAQ